MAIVDEINKQLKLLETNKDRLDAISQLLDGICRHCGRIVGKGELPCRCDDDE